MLSTLKLCFQSVPENAVEFKTVKIQSWYCKPAILESLGDYFQRKSNQIPTDPQELFRIVMCALKSNFSVNIDGFIYQPIEKV